MGIGGSESSRAPVLVALGLLVAALTETWVTGTAVGPRGTETLVSAVSCLPLVAVVRRPGWALSGALAGILLPLALTPGRESDGLALLLAWLVAVYGANAYGSLRTGLLGSTAVAAALTTMIVVLAPADGRKPADIAWALGVVASAAAAGQVFRSTLVRKERDRARAAEDARAEERQRIAREVHDVVAHALALMVVQAGAAQRLLGTDAARVSGLLEGVQHSGEQAARELRLLLNVLGDEVGPGVPSSDLGRLLVPLRDAGLPVNVLGELPQGLPAEVDRAVFRVVQEALTNAVKHGSHTAATVRVTAMSDRVEVEVIDRSTPATAAPEVGLGLAGLRERLAVHHGRLEAGPVGSDWRVRAVMPLVGSVEA